MLEWTHDKHEELKKVEETKPQKDNKVHFYSGARITESSINPAELSNNEQINVLMNASDDS